MKTNTKLLLRLENIRKHNEIIRTKENIIREKRMAKELILQYKELINKKEREILNFKEKIEQLNQEKEFYQKTLQKIPRFITRIFIGKTLALEGEKIYEEQKKN